MRVFVTGGTGLIGRHIVRKLLERGDEPVILTRQADLVRRNPSMRAVRVIQGDPSVSGAWDGALDGCDAVVNLVGHNIFADRWGPSVKRKIRDSRVYSTEHVIAAVSRAQTKPRVFVQASAIGYYGPHADEELTESSPSGSDFMAVVCREWEEAAAPAEAMGLRLATIRTGVVLARGEGALGAMTPIYKWLPGGAAPVGGGGSPLKPGSGRQWMSWIHLDDIVGLFLLALDNPSAQGPINGSAPNPVRHSEFSKALASVLWRPHLPFGPPDAVLDLVLGEVAQVVTKGQKVLPVKAQQLGYAFKYPQLLPALKAVFARQEPAARPAPAHAHPAPAGHH
jgi:uncharacterized protein (TIGR01777 family)